MQTATRTDLDHLAGLVYSLRPDWQEWQIKSVLQSHAHQASLADLAVAAIRYAADRTNRDHRGIGWRGAHWKGLDTSPSSRPSQRIRCYVCGKPEDRCILERPGPDDHAFEPTEPADLAVTR